MCVHSNALMKHIKYPKPHNFLSNETNSQNNTFLYTVSGFFLTLEDMHVSS